MANNNDITREPFTQSKIFKNILLAGMEMATFLDKAEFGGNTKQKECAEKTVKYWRKVCNDFANDEERKQHDSRYNGILDRVAEYLEKSKSMAEIAQKANFDEISAETLKRYFEELFVLIDTAAAVFERLQ